MEKIVGMDLHQYMKEQEQRPIDQKLAIEWLKELVTILGKVHDKNFFHNIREWATCFHICVHIFILGVCNFLCMEPKQWVVDIIIKNW
jgi:serine/threonine protein kinase